jgi:hypothetical protein
MNTQTLTHPFYACASLLLIVSCGNPRPQFQAEDGLLSKSTVAQLAGIHSPLDPSMILFHNIV